MAEYQLAMNDHVIRAEDGATIPNDPGNKDRREYEEWLKAGGVPDPADPLPVFDPPEYVTKDEMADLKAQMLALQEQLKAKR